jgi:hypothetical protein
MSASNSDREAVEKLAEEFAERYRRGERPSLTEYVEKYPDLGEEIRALFPALVLMERFGSVAGAPSGPDIGLVAGGAQKPQQLGNIYSVEVDFADNGTKKSQMLSPFQQPVFKSIQVRVVDSNDHGIPDQVVLTARKGKRTVTMMFPG